MQVITEVTGGLGNQMFQYAAARSAQLSLGNGCRCVLVDRQDGAVAHAVCGLGKLTLSPEVELRADPGYMKREAPFQNSLRSLALRVESRGGMMGRDWSGFERRIRPLLNLFGTHLCTEGYLPCKSQGFGGKLLLWGYFQGESWFAPHAAQIKAELIPREIPTGAFAEALAQANRAGRTVCVHVRRGDYLRPENAALQVCTPAYYARAIAAAEAALPGAVFVFFSDDPSWVAENLRPAHSPALYAPAGGTAVGDLALMRQCTDFILSNSTYSWWAQYLSDAPEKKVFAPEKWYANGKKTALYQPDWSLLKV